jgi:N-glycosylase/DNA lyase
MDQIADSGQCFRISKIAADCWRVAAFDNFLTIHSEGEGNYVFDCSWEEFEKIWFNYFDMPRDYGKIKADIRLSGDPYLIAAVNYGYGIRILKQDLWETLVTFIISQRNSITRIKSIVNRLCEPFGNCFPLPHLLEKYTEKDFLSLGVGYRARYLRNIVKVVLDNSLNLGELKNMECYAAINYLKRFDGIGDKVANCVALFGLHKVDAFPIDVWIRRIIDEQYGGHFDADRFAGYAGIVQQYMFFYRRFFSRRDPLT